MKGLHVPLCYTAPGAHCCTPLFESGTHESALSFIIAPILPQLDELFWACGNEAFRCPLPRYECEEAFEAERDSYVMGRCHPHQVGSCRIGEEWTLYRKGFLGHFITMVSDDWNALYGFREQPDLVQLQRMLIPAPSSAAWDPEQLAREHTSRLLEFIRNHVDVLLSNVDAAYWEVYARDEELLTTLETSLGVHQRELEQAGTSISHVELTTNTYI